MLNPKGSERDLDEIGEINVTPFIDVMLVLLVIFMVAAPLATVNVPLDLPVSSAAPQEPPPDPVVLSIQSDQSWSIGDQPIERSEMEAILRARTSGDLSTRIFVRADRSVSYQDLMDAMNALRDAGFLKVSLVGVEGQGKAP